MWAVNSSVDQFYDVLSTECDGGMFGINCKGSCGKCLNNKQCNHINGSCLNGCESGYSGTNCTEGNAITT